MTHGPGGMRSVYFTPEHEAVRTAARRFLEDEVAPHADAWEKAGRIPRGIFARMGQLGLLGVSAPPELGGAGGDLFFALALLEELPRSLMGGFCAAVSVQQFMATQHILRWGSDDLKARYVAPSISGRLVGALGVSEPDAGSDVAAIRTRAVRDGDSWVVSGVKTFITNGADGDFVTLAVRTDAEAGAGVLSLLVVELDTPGVRVARRLDKLGWHSSDTAELTFDDARVPAVNLVGAPGMGFPYLMDAFQLERLVGAGIAVGSCDLCLDRTLGHLRQRQVAGQPLTRFHALAHRLADLAAQVEGARALTYQAAWLLERGDGAVRECSMAKLVATELAKRVADECLQCYGGYDFTEEPSLARFLRDTRAGTIAVGTSEVMREIVARIMIEGEEPAPVGRRAEPEAVRATPASAAPSPAAPSPAAPSPAPSAAASAAPQPVPATVEALMASLPHRLRPEKVEGWRACFHFKLRGADAAEWTIRIADGRCEVDRGLVGSPDCVVETKEETYVGIETGSVSPQVAFMMGKVKVSDLAQMMRFAKAFRPARTRR